MLAQVSNFRTSSMGISHLVRLSNNWAQSLLLLDPVLHTRDYNITGATMCHRKQWQVKCMWTDVDNEKPKKYIHPDLHKFLLDSSPNTVRQIENLLAIISQWNSDGLWVTNQERVPTASLSRSSLESNKMAHTVTALWSDFLQYNPKCHPVYFFQLLMRHLFLELR